MKPLALRQPAYLTGVLTLVALSWPASANEVAPTETPPATEARTASEAQTASEANVVEQTQPQKRSKTVVIESQVTGSTEQPNVTYIIPWRGIEQPIKVVNEKMVLTPPRLQLINPAKFQRKVSDYADTQTSEESQQQ